MFGFDFGLKSATFKKMHVMTLIWTTSQHRKEKNESSTFGEKRAEYENRYETDPLILTEFIV